MVGIVAQAEHLLTHGDNIRVKDAQLDSHNGSPILCAKLEIYTFGGWHTRDVVFQIPRGARLLPDGLSVGYDNTLSLFFISGRHTGGGTFKIHEDD